MGSCTFSESRVLCFVRHGVFLPTVHPVFLPIRRQGRTGSPQLWVFVIFLVFLMFLAGRPGRPCVFGFSDEPSRREARFTPAS
jgi:hypothetical protein